MNWEGKRGLRWRAGRVAVILSWEGEKGNIWRWKGSTLIVY
jgi:hypothetical protein